MTTTAERLESLSEILEDYAPLDPKCPRETKPKRFALICAKDEAGPFWVTTHANLKEAADYLNEDKSDYMPEVCFDLDTELTYLPEYEFYFVEADESEALPEAAEAEEAEEAKEEEIH